MRCCSMQPRPNTRRTSLPVRGRAAFRNFVDPLGIRRFEIEHYRCLGIPAEVFGCFAHSQPTRRTSKRWRRRPFLPLTHASPVTLRRLRAYAPVRERGDSGHEVADAPPFERYGDDFDGQAGAGGIEVWLPIGR